MSLTKISYSMITGEVANVLDFGAIGNDDADCTEAFATALASGAKTIYVPYGIYRISSPLTYGTNGQKIYGENGGPFSNYTTMIKYVGAATSSPMFTVPRGYDNCGIEGIRLNANNVADICFQVVGVAGASDATHCPFFRNMSFVGYVTRGLVLGLNSTSTICADQLNMVTMDKIMFEGGTAGAIGLLVNAQNLEFLVANSIAFEPTVGGEHLHHIYCYTGGLNIQGMVSTRATDYAIFTYSSQLVINGWRSEDTLGLQIGAVGGTGPSFLCGVLCRGGGVVPADPWIDFGGTEGPCSIVSCELSGSVAIEPTARKNFTALNVKFGAGANYLIYGPTNLGGILHNADTGNVDLYGTSPAINLYTETGVSGTGLHYERVSFGALGVAASVPNKSLFIDSSNNKLSYKDNAGTVYALY